MEKKNDYDVPQKVTPEFCLQCLENDNICIRDACLKFLIHQYLAHGNSVWNIFTSGNLNLGHKYFEDNCKKLIAELFHQIKKNDSGGSLDRFFNIIDSVFAQPFISYDWFKHLLKIFFEMDSANPLCGKCALILKKYFHEKDISILPGIIKESKKHPELLDLILIALQGGSIPEIGSGSYNFSCFSRHFWKEIGNKIPFLSIQQPEKTVKILTLMIPLADPSTLYRSMDLFPAFTRRDQDLLQDLIAQRCKTLESNRENSQLLVLTVSKLPWKTAISFFQRWLTYSQKFQYHEILCGYFDLLARNWNKKRQKHLQTLSQHLTPEATNRVLQHILEAISTDRKDQKDFLLLLIRFLNQAKYYTAFNADKIRIFLAKIKNLLDFDFKDSPQICSELEKLYLTILSNVPVTELVKTWLPSCCPQDSIIDYHDSLRQLKLSDHPRKAQKIWQKISEDCQKYDTMRKSYQPIVSFVNQHYGFDWQVLTTPSTLSLEQEYLNQILKLFAC